MMQVLESKKDLDNATYLNPHNVFSISPDLASQGVLIL